MKFCRRGGQVTSKFLEQLFAYLDLCSSIQLLVGLRYKILSEFLFTFDAIWAFSCNQTVNMATGTLEQSGPDIREGLICPICLEDLGTVNQLLSHFESAHDTEEEKDILQSFKGEDH